MAWYLWAMIFAGLALALAYQQGKKTNLALLHRAAGDLERIFQPDDKLYTWIGGLVGFHAEYRFDSGPLLRIEATVTLLPRHSPLFMPVSWLLFRSDRLFLTGFLRERFQGEWHLVKPSRLRRLGRELAAKDLDRRDIDPRELRGGFVLLSPRFDKKITGRPDEQSGQGADEVIDQGVRVCDGEELAGSLVRLVSSHEETARRLVHLALVDDLSTLFVFQRGLDAVESAARLLLDATAVVGRFCLSGDR